MTTETNSRSPAATWAMPALISLSPTAIRVVLAAVLTAAPAVTAPPVSAGRARTDTIVATPEAAQIVGVGSTVREAPTVLSVETALVGPNGASVRTGHQDLRQTAKAHEGRARVQTVHPAQVDQIVPTRTIGAATELHADSRPLEVPGATAHGVIPVLTDLVRTGAQWTAFPAADPTVATVLLPVRRVAETPYAETTAAPNGTKAARGAVTGPCNGQ